MGEIEQTCRQNGIEVLSFHPFSSPMESVYLFSTYDRRIEEMIQLYSEFFGTMKRLGAKIFVLHGAILSSKCPPEHYVKQFRLLAETGRKYGVTVAQENVSYCLSGDLEFLKMMKRELGGYARFVLDLKQVRRAHGDTFEYIRALGENIVHLHISDGSVERDCLPVGHGEFDFRRLMQGMDALGYSGAYMMELYRQNYDEFAGSGSRWTGSRTSRTAWVSDKKRPPDLSGGLNCICGRSYSDSCFFFSSLRARYFAMFRLLLSRIAETAGMLRNFWTASVTRLIPVKRSC